MNEQKTIVARGQVVRREDGSRYVARENKELPEGHKILNGKPHEEGTEAAGFEYLCLSEYCRCSE